MNLTEEKETKRFRVLTFGRTLKSNEFVLFLNRYKSSEL